MVRISSNRIALLLAIALPLCWGCGDEPGADDKTPADTTATAAVATPVPPRAESKFQNAAVDVDYVGSQRCVTCHADQHATCLLYTSDAADE